MPEKGKEKEREVSIGETEEAEQRGEMMISIQYREKLRNLNSH